MAVAHSLEPQGVRSVPEHVHLYSFTTFLVCTRIYKICLICAATMRILHTLQCTAYDWQQDVAFCKTPSAVAGL